jgi:hypothetical protein
MDPRQGEFEVVVTKGEDEMAIGGAYKRAQCHPDWGKGGISKDTVQLGCGTVRVEVTRIRLCEKINRIAIETKAEANGRISASKLIDQTNEEACLLKNLKTWPATHVKV